MSDDDVVAILNEGANEHSALARVFRHVEDRPVCPHVRDFYVAMKYRPAVVVRVRADLPGGRRVAADCRYRNGAVEFVHEHRDVGITGSEQFVEDVREADDIEVVHHHNSQFGTGEGWTCYNCGGEFFDPESKFVEATNEVRVTCPDCGAVDEIPQGTEPPREPERDVVTDGGRDLPSVSDWPYEAVVHGADLRRDCLALTGSGKPCSYQAYSGKNLCSTHRDANDPHVVDGAHQWARISDGETTIVVCVNCEQVWEGGSPALAVDCPTCGRGAGSRCLIENSRSAGTNAPIPPHPERRVAGREVLDDYETCPEAPVPAVDDGQTRLTTDGGTPTAGTYQYAVSPANEIFETRHEAVGFAAVHGRKYTYSPMNSIDGPVSLRIEPFRYDETGTDGEEVA